MTFKQWLVDEDINGDIDDITKELYTQTLVTRDFNNVDPDSADKIIKKLKKLGHKATVASGKLVVNRNDKLNLNTNVQSAASLQGP